jgi:uncharacterized protein YdhG (YjbR/CyaY superfamily)
MNALDKYISEFPEEVRKILDQVRETIKNVATDATETINYGIPTFKMGGNLVHFAGFKHHIGFYPGPSGIEAFKSELSAYKGAKGSVQFPLDKPIPYELIGRIVKFRVQEINNKSGK